MDVRHGMLLGTLFLGGCGVAGDPSIVTVPTADPEPTELRLRAVGDAPAIEHDDVGAAYVLPATAIQADGVTHAWVVTFEGTDGESPRVEHLTSSDLETWTVAQGGTAFVGLELDPIGPIPSSVLVADDGTWVMYGSGRQPIGTSVIWRATADGPDGPWRLDADPILVPMPGTWASAIVDHPSVVRTDSGYLMAFGGASLAGANRNRIGSARSTDGIAWELVDAVLPDADDAQALGPTACGVDARTMFEPQLIATDEVLRLYFGQMQVPDDAMVIGAATSHDGTTWTCASDGPAFEPSELPGSPNAHSYLALRRGGVDVLLLETLDGASASSDIWRLQAD